MGNKAPVIKDARWGDQWHFLRRLLANPRRIGAIAPSGPALAQAMALQVRPEYSGPILELGPGSGVITKALLESGISPERLILIERDPAFAPLLADRFPGVTVIQGDAFDLERILMGRDRKDFAAVLSGLPLLNFPLEKRRGLLDVVLEQLAPGAPFIQFSYGLKKPVSPAAGVSAKHAAFVWDNLPPAHVWVYRRA